MAVAASPDVDHALPYCLVTDIKKEINSTLSNGREQTPLMAQGKHTPKPTIQ